MPDNVFKAEAVVVDKASGPLKAIRQSLTELSRTGALKQLTRDMEEMRRVMAPIGENFGAIGVGLKGFGLAAVGLGAAAEAVKKVAESVRAFARERVDLQYTADSIGVTADQLARMQAVGTRFHIVPTQMAADVKHLRTLLEEVQYSTAAGREAMLEFNKEGLGPMAEQLSALARSGDPQKLQKALELIYNTMQGIDPRLAGRVAEQAFGDPAQAHVRNYKDELDAVTDVYVQQLKQMQEIDEEWDKFERRLDSVKKKLVETVAAPVVKWGLDVLTGGEAWKKLGEHSTAVPGWPALPFAPDWSKLGAGLGTVPPTVGGDEYGRMPGQQSLNELKKSSGYLKQIVDIMTGSIATPASFTPGEAGGGGGMGALAAFSPGMRGGHGRAVGDSPGLPSGGPGGGEGILGSYFTDPSTASGKSAATTEGIALPSGGHMGDMYKITLPDGRTFTAPLIDRGPAKWTGRGVDISLPLAKKMGIDPTGKHFKVEPVNKVPGKGVSASDLAAGGPPISPDAVTAVGGVPPAAFIMHHTSSRGTIAGIESTLKQRHLGVEYVMDRDGNIKKTGGPGSANILPGWGKLGAGLSNKNIVGMEVIAKDDKDVTPAQVAAAKAFIAKNYPRTPVFGHGEVNPGHKEADEGMTIVNAIRAERADPTHDFAARPGSSHRHRPDFFRGHGNWAVGDRLSQALKHTVDGNAHVTVDFKNMPKGVTGDAKADGVFKSVTTNRATQMPNASMVGAP
jgi:hypothetical protein